MNHGEVLVIWGCRGGLANPVLLPSPAAPRSAGSPSDVLGGGGGRVGSGRARGSLGVCRLFQFGAVEAA